MSLEQTSDPTEAIRAALVNVVNFVGAMTVETVASELWASDIFSGARHQLRVRLHGHGAVGATASLLERLDEVELALPGRFLADLALLSYARSDDGNVAILVLEALIIDE